MRLGGTAMVSERLNDLIRRRPRVRTLKLRLGGNLWRHREFMRFWFSDTVSQFGNQFSGFALPVLAVLSFNATPLDIGIITALAIVTLPPPRALRRGMGRQLQEEADNGHLQFRKDG